MSRFFLSLILLSFSVQTFAQYECANEAIYEAKVQAFSTSILESIEPLPSQRNYLETFKVTLKDRANDPTRFESYILILFKSSCDVASITQQF